MRPAVTHGKPLTGHPVEIGLPLRCPIERRIADQDRLFRIIKDVLRREDNDLAAGQSLADIVVGLPFQGQRDAFRQEGPERLTGRADELNRDRVFRQPVRSVLLRNLAREYRARRPVDVPDRKFELDLLALLDRRLAEIDKLVIEYAGETMVLLLHTITRYIRRNIGSRQQRCEVQPLGFPVVDGFGDLELVHTADHLVDRPEAELRHQPPRFFGHEEEIVHDVFRLAVELLA